MVEMMVAENYSVDVIWQYVAVLQNVWNILRHSQVPTGLGKKVLYRWWVTREVIPEPEIEKKFAL